MLSLFFGGSGVQVLVICKSMGFGLSSWIIEPFYCTMYVYDIANKRRATEVQGLICDVKNRYIYENRSSPTIFFEHLPNAPTTFSCFNQEFKFDLNDDAMLTGELQVRARAADNITKSKRALFSLTNVHPGVLSSFALAFASSFSSFSFSVWKYHVISSVLCRIGVGDSNCACSAWRC